jgi:uncharacterized pyridoxamine 5'-phosphate oxidase family protein
MGGVYMQCFVQESLNLFLSFGVSANMVLSTSLNDHITSRTMSVIIIDNAFYFQTDINFRKHKQIQGNPKVSLCVDNVQIEGVCVEMGHPKNNTDFCKLYEQEFPGSFKSYTHLTNERLFKITPQYIQKWIYENGMSFIETYDFEKKLYDKKGYIGE